MKGLSRNKILFFTALLLLTAFALHTIHFDHHHPRELFGDEGVSALMHGEDKKWWLFVAVSTSLLFCIAWRFFLFTQHPKIGLE